MRKMLMAGGRVLLPALCLLGSACTTRRSRTTTPPRPDVAAQPSQAQPVQGAAAAALAKAAAPAAPPDAASNAPLHASPQAPLDAARTPTPPPAAAAPTLAVSPATRPAQPGEDVAILATTDALVRVSTRDKSMTELAHEHVTWCAVDNRAQAIWYLTAQAIPTPHQPESRGAAMLALKVIDLAELPEHSAPLTVVPPTRVRSSSPELRPVVSYGDAATVGDELSDFSAGILLQLNLAPRPRLRVELTCDGDAAWYCYQMDKEQEQLPGPTENSPDNSTEKWWPVNPDIAATLKDLKRMRLQQPDKLAALARRGAGRRQWLDEKDGNPNQNGDKNSESSRPLPKVKSVLQKACEEGGCGEAKVIPGTPYWAVVVASSRGDFFHETQQFYDPARKRFFDPRRPGLSAPRPLAKEKEAVLKPGDDAHSLSSMLIARSGQSLLMDGELIGFDRGVVFKGQRVCGFVGGGWAYTHLHP